MMWFIRVLFASVLITLSLLANTHLLAKPPVVEKAEPDQGAVDVDPDLREMRITFDQPMSKNGFSVLGGGPTFPVSGRPKWKDDRTIILPVKLKANQTYRLQINSDRKGGPQNFKNRRGEPAVAYPIEFRTAADGGKAPDSKQPSSGAMLSPKHNRRAVNLLRTAITKQYSYRDRLGIDWGKLIDSKRDALLNSKSAQDFSDVAAAMLATAEDKHLWLEVEGQHIPTFVRPVTPNANFRQLSKLVPDWQIRGQGVASGKLADDVGYLFIETWDQSKAKGLASIFDVLWEFSDTPALVIDLRANSGGSENIARSVAGCFIDEPVVYAKHILCDPKTESGFTQPHERTLVPNKRRPRYRGQIAVLTGPAVMSSSEAFLLMMKQVPNTVLIGAASQGSSGNPQPHDLDNGVTLYLPSWQAMTPEGEVFEGIGIPPDIEVQADPEDFATSDPVITAALRHLQKSIGR